MPDVVATLIGGAIGFVSGATLALWNASRSELKASAEKLAEIIEDAADAGTKCWLSKEHSDERLYLEARTRGLQELMLGFEPAIMNSYSKSEKLAVDDAVIKLIPELTGYDFSVSNRLPNAERAAALQVEASRAVLAVRNAVSKRLTLRGAITARLGL